MSDEGEKDDAPNNSNNKNDHENDSGKQSSEIIGLIALIACGLYFLSLSLWMLCYGEWPVWMEPKLHALLSVFEIFGKIAAIYCDAAFTGLIGLFCLCTPIFIAVISLVRRRHD